MAKTEYDGVEDAETILRRIMKRDRFCVGVRDELAAALTRIVRAETAKVKGGWGGKGT